LNKAACKAVFLLLELTFGDRFDTLREQSIESSLKNRFLSKQLFNVCKKSHKRFVNYQVVYKTAGKKL